MSNFNLKTAIANKIVREARSAEPKEKIFDKYLRLTNEKIDQSISDAKGRYVDGKGYAQAKPSKLWKVTKSFNPKAGETVIDEEVEVTLKVGIRKLPIDGEATSIKIPASTLLDTLDEMKQMLASIAEDRTSEVARDFHKVAIQAGKPPSAPKAADKVGWSYNKETDLYDAV